MSDPNAKNSTSRFSNRVEHYVRARPDYPSQALDLIEEACGRLKGQTIADIGSGTGILSALLMDRGAIVHGIEPNGPMREAAESLLKDRGAAFISRQGTAEHTGLPDHSIDGITAAQAFHWFDPARAREEFTRILRPEGFVALLWNSWPKETSPFMVAFRAFTRRFAKDFDQVNHTDAAGEAEVKAFFAPASCLYAAFPNHQLFDRDKLLSRVLSSSYMPTADDPVYPEMCTALDELYDTHVQHGRVVFDYTMEMYFGKLTPQ